MTPEMTVNLMMAAIGLMILAVLGWSGMLGARAFNRAPNRSGRLELMDFLNVLGLHILGSGFTGIVQKYIIGSVDFDHADAHTLFVHMVIFQSGMIPCAVYIVIRSSMTVEGGLKGFGLGLNQLWRSPIAAIIGTLVILPLSLAASGITWLIVSLSGGEVPRIAHDILKVIAEPGPDLSRFGLITLAIVAAPVLEELMFRGFLQTAIRHTIPIQNRWFAIILASIFFTSVHLGVGSVFALPTLAVLSLGLGWIYERTGNLWASIGVHALFNASQIALTLLVPVAEGGQTV